MKKFKLFFLILPLFSFLLLACGNDEEEIEVFEEVEVQEKTLLGGWNGLWIQEEVHYDTKLPEGNCDEVEFWDPEFHRSEGGVEWALNFTVNENNFVNISDGGEGELSFKGAYEISFETEWNCNRTIKWSGNVSEDFNNIEGHWELHHPIYELMSSGAWSVNRF